MNPRAREHRFRRLKEMGCFPCDSIGIPDVYPEIHHLNGGGHAGQKRRGDEFTIPLCEWHHQGKLIPGQTETQMLMSFGPSLKLHSRLFRHRFGSDDGLLAKVNKRIAQMDAVAKGEALPEALESP